MKIIIPFKKEVVFKDNISEVTSISLEDTLSVTNEMIKGNFAISGEYKTNSNSISVLPFALDLPIAIAIEDKYDSSEAICDIDDFYYEIINERKLAISIDISIDKLKEKELNIVKDEIAILESELDRMTENEKLVNEEIEQLEDRCVEDEDDMDDNMDEIQERVEQIKKINESKPFASIFNNLEDTDQYISYSIYIVREGDTIESIVNDYNVDLELIKEYNNINDLKIGDKIIIPTKCEN